MLNTLKRVNVIVPITFSGPSVAAKAVYDSDGKKLNASDVD
jgi:hypothetical protein